MANIKIKGITGWQGSDQSCEKGKSLRLEKLYRLGGRTINQVKIIHTKQLLQIVHLRL